MSEQLNINFKPNKYVGHEHLREFINDSAIPSLLSDPSNNFLKKKQIAMEMDLAPSLHTKKLADYSDNAYSTDDLENYIKKTGDVEPIKWLVWTYMRTSVEEKDKEIENLRRQLAEAVK